MSFLKNIIFDKLIIIISAIFSILFSLTYFSETETFRANINWIQVWVMVWSVKQKTFKGIISGLIMGLIQDSLTVGTLSSIPSLVVIGALSSRFRKNYFIRDNLYSFLSIILLVFILSLIAQGIILLQYTLQDIYLFEHINIYHQEVLFQY